MSEITIFVYTGACQRRVRWKDYTSRVQKKQADRTVKVQRKDSI